MQASEQTEGLIKFVSFGIANPSTTQSVVPLPLQVRLALFCDFSASEHDNLSPLFLASEACINL